MNHETLFTRAPSNPIIRPQDLSVPCIAVCNPGAHLVDDDVLLLLRVVDPDNHSHVRVARSRDGVGEWRFDPAPFFGAGVCLAATKDFTDVQPLGLVIHPYNKDAALFPRQIGGRYYLLHRPTAGPLENIWVADSDNLTEWGNPRCVLEESDQPGWYSGKVGAGPPPIETERG